MAITTKKQRQQRRNEALQLIADGVPPTDAARINRSRHPLSNFSRNFWGPSTCGHGLRDPRTPFFEALVGWLAGYSAERAFFTASPASTAVPAANATSPPSPTNWF